MVCFTNCRFSNGLVYFGASYGASDFGGNMYVNFALASVVEISAHLLSTHNCERYMLVFNDRHRYAGCLGKKGKCLPSMSN